MTPSGSTPIKVNLLGLDEATVTDHLMDTFFLDRSEAIQTNFRTTNLPAGVTAHTEIVYREDEALGLPKPTIESALDFIRPGSHFTNIVGSEVALVLTETVGLEVAYSKTEGGEIPYAPYSHREECYVLVSRPRGSTVDFPTPTEWVIAE